MTKSKSGLFSQCLSTFSHENAKRKVEVLKKNSLNFVCYFT